MNEMMNEKKWYDKDDFATRGVGNTALGLSIAALGTQLLGGNLGNILGGITGNNNVPFEESAFGLYKNQRDIKDELVSKSNADLFALYKGQRDSYDELKAQIDAINTKLAVDAATQQWKDKSIYDAIALEAERRCCNDGKIVTYANQTFAPKYVADFTIGTGTTQQSIFNPLCGCGCGTTM